MTAPAIDLHALKTRALDLLTALGEDARQVAERLAAAGVTGIPNSCCHCVIAVFLRRELRLLQGALVQVSPDAITVLPDPKDRAVYVEFRPPAAVADLISGFDQGRHTELIAATTVRGGGHV